MIHISQLNELNSFIINCKAEGKKIGFVPTLGALHDGHMSLIRKASEKADVIICSIFVNPTQFDDKEDLKKYPRTITKDIEKLRAEPCDVCFTPSVEEVYPNGMKITKSYQLGRLEHILEGETRPGHYQGVCQVVERLLKMVQPDVLFLGQKDFQQVMILSKMIEQREIPVQVEMCPIIREHDGLARSSRNVRLTDDERLVSNQLYKTLLKCKESAKKIEITKLKTWAEVNLNLEPLITVDYIRFCDAKTLEEIYDFEDAEHVVLLGAIFIGQIRLIDNLIIC